MAEQKGQLKKMKQKKIEYIQENIKHCGTNACKVYSYGSIPKKLLSNAYNTYVKPVFGHSVHFDDILGLVDTSFTGNGKAGLLFTEEGIFYKEFMNKPGFISYRTIKKTDHIPEAVYAGCNQSGLKRLVDGLIGIDTKEDWNNLADTINEKIDHIDDTIDNITEVGERIVDILENIYNKVRR